MNKVGIHALVWAGSWGARECEYTVASSKEAGYDLVEFPVFQPAAMDIEAIQRALSANGMTATCSLGLSFDKDINSEDPACVARGEVVLHDALMAARDLGSPYLGGVIFSALGPYSAMPTERSRQNSIVASGGWRSRRRRRASRWASRSSTATSRTSSTPRSRRSRSSRRSVRRTWWCTWTRTT